MKSNWIVTYLLIAVGYWLTLIWRFGGYQTKAYLFGNALVWPVSFFEWLLSWF